MTIYEILNVIIKQAPSKFPKQAVLFEIKSFIRLILYREVFRLGVVKHNQSEENERVIF